MSDNKDLIIPETITSIMNYLPEHGQMVESIKASLPEIQRASSFFFKSQSQFMDSMLTVSHTTPIRNLRQILSEMNRTREALRENHFKLKKSETELKIMQRSLNEETDDLKKELIQIEIDEKLSSLDVARGYISGAIRKLANYTDQYNSILESMGKKDFNEIDFEAEEEKYHIQKAFEQAMCAARSRQGIIDEGNLIYFTQIGINGGSAQKDIFAYFQEEANEVASGRDPSHEMFLQFLERMAEKYKGCATMYANYKGMKSVINERAALSKGDTRLLDQK